MRQRDRTSSDLAGLGELADPMRRRLYEYVAAQDEPVRRDDAAAAVGISRSLAAYHLDKLADAGLLATGYARPHGQGGPGAGRPAKRYRPVADEVSVSIPPRTYALLARLLADAAAGDESGAVQAALMTAAEREGREAGADEEDLVTTLAERGYEPEVTGEGDVEMLNCPFHQAAQHQAELVCGMNHALLRGVLEGRGEDPDRAELAPGEGRCCVVVHPCGCQKE